MDQIQAWSKLYGLNRKTMRQMHSAEDSLGVFYNNQALITQVFKVNSGLLHEFLTSLPAPTKKQEKVGIRIEFMFPTVTAFHELFESLFHPKFKFMEMEEIATRYWDWAGIEFYAGPIDRKKSKTGIVLPTYVQAFGAWEKGFQHLVKEEMPKMLVREFFVSSMAIGNFYDGRKKKVDLNHENVCVGGYSQGYLLSYSCNSNQGIYNPSSGLGGGELDIHWDEASCKSIEEKIEKLNVTFFKREIKEKELKEAF